MITGKRRAVHFSSLEFCLSPTLKKFLFRQKRARQFQRRAGDRNAVRKKRRFRRRPDRRSRVAANGDARRRYIKLAAGACLAL